MAKISKYLKLDKDILLEWGLYFNNSIREIVLEKELVSYIDIYSRSQGSGLDNVFYYNFCLNSDPLIYQPSGAINISKINNIYMSYKLIDPLLKISMSDSYINDPFLYASVKTGDDFIILFLVSLRCLKSP